MEGPPRHESSPQASKERAIELLREKGPENEEALAALNAWLDAEQKKVEAGSISNLDFNIAWAEVYRDAGLTDAAREAFDQCAELAFHEHDDDKLKYCEVELEKLWTE